MKITRVSNCGILLEIGTRNYLIDGFNTDEVHPYYATDPALYHELMDAEDENYLVFTHAHPDHFNAVMTMEYLYRHEKTKVIGPEPVLEKLTICGIPRDRMIAAEDLHMDPNREISAFRTMHIGAPYRHVIHYSYYISGEESLMFIGDATPIKDNYREFSEFKPHITVLASNYAHIIGSGSRMLDLLDPEHTVVLHLPNPLEDENHLIEMTDEAAHKIAKDITLLSIKDSISF